MGHKTHPIGFRLGVIREWDTRWFAAKGVGYRAFVKEDLKIRQTIQERFEDAGISRIEIERGSSDLIVTIHTSRPGIVIGRGGQRVEELRKDIEEVSGTRARLNVQEIRQPELDAYLVARSIADQLERRIAFRRAMRQAVSRTMQAGALGIKALVGGRLGGADIARKERAMDGRVPLHTLRADIDYGLAEAATDFGRIGVKVWVYKGDVIEAPFEPEPEIEDIKPIEVTVRAEEEREAEREAAAAAAAAQQQIAAAEAEEAATESPQPEASPPEAEEVQ